MLDAQLGAGFSETGTHDDSEDIAVGFVAASSVGFPVPWVAQSGLLDNAHAEEFLHRSWRRRWTFS